MKQDANCPKARVSLASLPAQWQMLGVHGQHIGSVDACGIDLDSGRVAYVLLVTPLQSITIPWERVQFDYNCRCIQLLPAENGSA